MVFHNMIQIDLVFNILIRHNAMTGQWFLIGTNSLCDMSLN